MLLKLLKNQLDSHSDKFLPALKNSSYYEHLLRYVCQESSQETKGEIVPIQWLEQACVNIRKHVAENQFSLLKTQETQMKLVDDKIYAAVLNQGQAKEYTRAKLMMAFNHKVFT